MVEFESTFRDVFPILNGRQLCTHSRGGNSALIPGEATQHSFQGRQLCTHSRGGNSALIPAIASGLFPKNEYQPLE